MTAADMLEQRNFTRYGGATAAVFFTPALLFIHPHPATRRIPPDRYAP